MIENQYFGVVENGQFQIRHREPLDCNQVKLTRIPVQAAQFPESVQIDLSYYEGQNITASGNLNGCWVFSAEVISE
ncbi:hypothetical protein [Bacillus sp. 'calajunan']|uniref:hypothetical protein n=1 Tax=Bacillus sp. 'calajunan' TaxID=3447457 RepID=UPI003EDEB034